MKVKAQTELLRIERPWEPHWRGMPAYEHRDLEPWFSLSVKFRTREDRDRFARKVAQTITDRTQSIWYPRAEIGRFRNKRFVTPAPVLPRWPVYIVSKGRYDSRLTAKSLDAIGVPYFIVVEEFEFEKYAAVIPPERVLILPRFYLDLYDTCDDLGSTKSKGPGAARNFAWEHSASLGARYHWVLDDNISGFYRYQHNLKTPVATGATFRAAEDFVDRYDNVAISGMNYFMFVSRKSGRIPPYTLNTRIYSILLIRNDIPYRWRGRYNEDTDICIRALRDGYCTVLFNAFLAFKETTQTLRGGNTEEFYRKEGTLNKSKMIEALHPDIARVAWRFNRWHHYVDYSVFERNELRYKPGYEPDPGVDNYGMTLEITEEL